MGSLGFMDYFLRGMTALSTLLIPICIWLYVTRIPVCDLGEETCTAELQQSAKDNPWNKLVEAVETDRRVRYGIPAAALATAGAAYYACNESEDGILEIAAGKVIGKDAADDADPKDLMYWAIGAGIIVLLALVLFCMMCRGSSSS